MNGLTEKYEVTDVAVDMKYLTIPETSTESTESAGETGEDAGDGTEAESTPEAAETESE